MQINCSLPGESVLEGESSYLPVCMCSSQSLPDEIIKITTQKLIKSFFDLTNR